MNSAKYISSLPEPDGILEKALRVLGISRTELSDLDTESKQLIDALIMRALSFECWFTKLPVGISNLELQQYQEISVSTETKGRATLVKVRFNINGRAMQWSVEYS